MPERSGGLSPSEGKYLSADEEYKKQLEAKQEKLGRFKLGQTVNVKRNSGEMESDWFVSGYNEAKNKVVVMKNGEPEETLPQQFVSIEDLESWNPE